MSIRITRHGKTRLVQRVEDCNNFDEAKRLAKIAKVSGLTINHFQSYPKFFSYLQRKNNKTNSQIVKVYKGQIFIWKGKNKTFVTAYPIPYRFIKEMEGQN